MEIIYYNDLEINKVKKQYEKVLNFLKLGDFKSADVKKIPNLGFYRAKLDDTNRLLFQIAEFNNKKYILLLEVILNHAYENSRFLNGAKIDETKLLGLNSEKDLKLDDYAAIGYVNESKKSFYVLDKILSFDDIQDDILKLQPPLIIIGSAGSGKTALTLEKIKTLTGKILYTTLSSFLVENAQRLYYSFEYDNQKQEIDFLSFNDYLSTIDTPQGKELDFKAFHQWAVRYSQSHKIKDTYKIFEEFKGVLTGSVVDKAYLSEDDYLNLGIKQSIFSSNERALIYDLFKKFIEWLKENTYFDANIASFERLTKIEQKYDFVVVDEVQDLTNVQLMAILKSLNNASNFILCGDSNQIVHPNFFSWSQVKSLFYKQDLKGNIIRVLATNYRNTPEVTNIANQLLMVKNARFGSIDKESTYLVKPNSTHKGVVEFLENNAKSNGEMNQKTKRSTRFAVIVMRNEDKVEARRYFQTPLVFSIHEAKGLEYENIILFNIISKYEKEFRELCNGVGKEDLDEANFVYGRAKDKADKSLEEYKFYINSLYVGITRAVKNLYVVETNKKHDLLQLLGLTNFKQQTSLKEQASSQDEWQQEAQKLAKQGKQEQAEAIQKDILKVQNVPWDVLTNEKIKELVLAALNPNHFNKKAKDSLFEYALFYDERSYFPKLSELNYRPADRWEQDGKGIIKRLYNDYLTDNTKQLLPKIQRYGIDFRNELNLTPLMLALKFEANNTIDYLLKNGSNSSLVDNQNKNALQTVLHNSYLDKSKKEAYLTKYYPLFKKESIKLKIDNKLVKLDSHQAEFLMLNTMFSILQSYFVAQTMPIKNRNDSLKTPTFDTSFYLDFFEGIDQHVLMEYRKKRSYISSMLSKNEVQRDDKYNKKLFMRLNQGNYLPNPKMEILINEEWINIYDTFDLDEVIINGKTSMNTLYFIKHFRNKMKKSQNVNIDDVFKEINVFANKIDNQNRPLLNELYSAHYSKREKIQEKYIKEVKKGWLTFLEIK
jgi:hypothetical protein